MMLVRVRWGRPGSRAGQGEVWRGRVEWSRLGPSAEQLRLGSSAAGTKCGTVQ